MPVSIVLVRRRGPDWPSLSRDFRAGRPVDRTLYLPEDGIIGMPVNLGDLIDTWNRRFSIDYFTFRAVLAAMTEQSVARVAGARRCGYDEVCDLANGPEHGDSYFFFHDDDDVFAPSLAAATADGDSGPDAIVCPIFRVGQRIETVVRDGCAVDHVWGKRVRPGRRYQTNNYGIHARHCRVPGPDMAALREHAEASTLADARGFVDRIVPVVASATIKTPSSVSAIVQVLEREDTCRSFFETCVRNFTAVDLPDRFGWVAEPVRMIGRLIDCVRRGGDYDAFSRGA